MSEGLWSMDNKKSYYYYYNIKIKTYSKKCSVKTSHLLNILNDF